MKQRRYSGRDPSEAERRYLADARLFVETGWVVQRVDWDDRREQPSLVATYARDAQPSLAGIGFLGCLDALILVGAVIGVLASALGRL